jgi:hypothetical protein
MAHLFRRFALTLFVVVVFGLPFSATPVAAQTGRITGVVTDTAGMPLEGVHIYANLRGGGGPTIAWRTQIGEPPVNGVCHHAGLFIGGSSPWSVI